MKKFNPLIIPRNHNVEKVLKSASEGGDMGPMDNLLKFLKNPYEEKPGIDKYQDVSGFVDKEYKTFCGT